MTVTEYSKEVIRKYNLADVAVLVSAHVCGVLLRVRFQSL